MDHNPIAHKSPQLFFLKGFVRLSADLIPYVFRLLALITFDLFYTKNASEPQLTGF